MDRGDAETTLETIEDEERRSGDPEGEKFLEENQQFGSSVKLKNITWKESYKQIIACLIAHTLVIQAGVNMAFSAVLLPQMNDNANDIPIDKDQASWIASLVTISSPIGALVYGPLMDRYGRKTLCIANTVPYIISWLLNANATAVWHIYVARFFAGFGGGLSNVSMVYVSEVTHPHFRSMLLNLNSVNVSLGILITCVLGLEFTWRTMAMVYCCMIMATLIMLWFIPESPHWLMIFRNDSAETRKAVKWLYKNEETAENQLDLLLESKKKHDATRGEQGNQTTTSILDKIKLELSTYKQPGVYKPFVLLLTLFVVQQLSGAYVIIFYAVDLFRRIGGNFSTGINEYIALVMLGGIRFVMSIISAFLSKKIGRRPLLMVSGAGMCATSLAAGLYMLWATPPGAKTTGDNIPLFCVLGYVCASAVGYLIIPWTLIVELLPVKVRGKLGSITSAFASLCLFVVVKIFPFVLDLVDVKTIFYAIAGVNLFGVVFVFVFLPETLGRTFIEIENYFEKPA